MSFLIEDKKLLEKYNKIWKKVSNIIENKFGGKPVYNEKYLKTKIKSYNEKINTNFHNNKIPIAGSQCICLSVILIDSVYRKDKSYYPQVFLEEYKYAVKEKKFIINDIEMPSDDSDKEDSGEKNSDEERSDETILMKKIIKYSFFFRKNKTFVRFVARKFHSQKYQKNIFYQENVRNFFRVGFFYFYV